MKMLVAISEGDNSPVPFYFFSKNEEIKIKKLVSEFNLIEDDKGFYSNETRDRFLTENFLTDEPLGIRVFRIEIVKIPINKPFTNLDFYLCGGKR